MSNPAISERISFVDWAASVWGSYRCLERSMVMFAAYFDESGTHDNNLLCVGGCLGTVHEWDKFGNAWNEALEAIGILDFHSKVFWSNNSDNSQKKLSDALSLAKIINDHSLYFFIRTICPEEYIRLTTANWRSRKGTAYTVATQVAIGSVLHWADNYDFQSQPIAFTFDQGHRNEDQAVIEMRKIQRTLIGMSYPQNSYVFANSKVIVQLQAADMITYLFYAHARGRLTPAKELVLNELRRFERYRNRHIDAEEIKLWLAEYEERVTLHRAACKRQASGTIEA